MYNEIVVPLFFLCMGYAKLYNRSMKYVFSKPPNIASTLDNLLNYFYDFRVIIYNILYRYVLLHISTLLVHIRGGVVEYFGDS